MPVTIVSVELFPEIFQSPCSHCQAAAANEQRRFPGFQTKKRTFTDTFEIRNEVRPDIEYSASK